MQQREYECSFTVECEDWGDYVDAARFFGLTVNVESDDPYFSGEYVIHD